MGTLYDFATSEASNSQTGGVNTAENQLPSTVNNALRAWKQLQAAWLDDIGGAAAGGSATAVTVTLAQGFTAYGTGAGEIGHGTVIALKMSAAATGAATLNVNTIGTKKIRRRGDSAIVANDWLANDTVLLKYDTAYDTAAGAWVLLNPLPPREVLTAARTYYVRADGSDSNNGLANTSGGAFLTIQKAVDVANSLDTATYAITIQVGAGTYAAFSVAAPLTGAGSLSIVGDTTTPSNVVVSSAGACITVDGFARISLAGLKLTSSGTHGLVLQGPCQVRLSGKMEFGSCASLQIFVLKGGYLQGSAAYTISGGAAVHWCVNEGGVLAVQGQTITLTGTPAFSSAFLNQTGGSAIVNGNTFSGSATGTRYSVSLNGTANTGGGGASYLPGNAGGSTATGGQYA